MTNMTLEQLETLIENFEEIQRLAAPVAEQLFEIKYDRCVGIDPEEITVESGGLYANFTEYGRCGSYEEHSLYIPLDHLFDNSWRDEAMAKIEAEKEAERLRKEKEKEEAKKKREEERYKKYRQLKMEFEGTDI